MSRESLFRFCKSHASYIRELVERNSFGYVILRESSRHVRHNFKARVTARARTRFVNDDEVSFPRPEVERSAMSKSVVRIKIVPEPVYPNPAWKTNMIHEKA